MDKHVEIIWLNNLEGDIKYYHLTNSSGYPSAEYHLPVVFHNWKSSMIIPEVRFNSANPFFRRSLQY